LVVANPIRGKQALCVRGLEPPLPTPSRVNRHCVLSKMVGVTGFEPMTTWSQARCATRLRYTPKLQNGSGRRIRTADLEVMSLARCQLRHPATNTRSLLRRPLIQQPAPSLGASPGITCWLGFKFTERATPDARVDVVINTRWWSG
jgi:hypothetical protein